MLTDAPRRNIIWRYSALGKLPPRRTPFGQMAPLGAHADAQVFGRAPDVFLGR